MRFAMLRASYALDTKYDSLDTTTDTYEFNSDLDGICRVRVAERNAPS